MKFRFLMPDICTCTRVPGRQKSPGPTCDVGSSVLVRVLFFNIGFNLLLHLGDKEVRLARQRGHVLDDV